MLAAGLMQDEPPSEEEEQVALLAALLHEERNGSATPTAAAASNRLEAGGTGGLTPPAASTGRREIVMKFNARLHRGSKTLEYDVELLAHGSVNGARQFRIGAQIANAQSEEITPGVYSLLLNGNRTKPLYRNNPAPPRPRRSLCNRSRSTAVRCGVARSAPVAA